MTEAAKDAAKRAAGMAGAGLVEDGMCVGLGTGSTTVFAIAELGRRVAHEGLRIVGTATSFAAERLARQHGVPLETLDTLERLDVALDGADEVDAAFRLIKGRGAAHTREKVVAAQADRFVVLVDESKLVLQLGSLMPVPVEVLPMAVEPVMRALRARGARPELRMGQRKDGPVVTDQGFWVVDAFFDGISDPADLDLFLARTPGVLDHGLFLDLATDVFVGRDDGSVEHRTRAD